MTIIYQDGYGKCMIINSIGIFSMCRTTSVTKTILFQLSLLAKFHPSLKTFPVRDALT